MTPSFASVALSRTTIGHQVAPAKFFESTPVAPQPDSLDGCPQPGRQQDLGLDENGDRSETDGLLAALAACTASAERTLLLERLIVLHLDLADAIAWHYARRGIEVDDLVQVARLALCKAIDRYRPGRGHSFRAYAAPTIAGELKRHFRDHAWSVRPPRRLQELDRDLRAREARLVQELGRNPTTSELAVALGTDESAVREVRAARTLSTPLSLDAPVGRGSAQSLSDVVPDADESGPFDAAEASTVLRPMLGLLGEREQRLIYLRFVRQWTQAEIGRAMGLSQMQVSRLIASLLAGLRDQLEPPSCVAISSNRRHASRAAQQDIPVATIDRSRVAMG